MSLYEDSRFTPLGQFSPPGESVIKQPPASSGGRMSPGRGGGPGGPSGGRAVAFPDEPSDEPLALFAALIQARVAGDFRRANALRRELRQFGWAVSPVSRSGGHI